MVSDGLSKAYHRVHAFSQGKLLRKSGYLHCERITARWVRYCHGRLEHLPFKADDFLLHVFKIVSTCYSYLFSRKLGQIPAVQIPRKVDGHQSTNPLIGLSTRALYTLDVWIPGFPTAFPMGDSHGRPRTKIHGADHGRTARPHRFCCLRKHIEIIWLVVWNINFIFPEILGCCHHPN